MTMLRKSRLSLVSKSEEESKGSSIHPNNRLSNSLLNNYDCEDVQEIP